MLHSNHEVSEKAINLFLSSGSNLTSGNLTFTSPNIYKYTLNNPLTVIEGAQVAFTQLQFTNSVQNLTTAFNNSSFSYINSAGVTRVVTIPNGYYTLNIDLDGLLQNAQIVNGDYLLDGSRNKITYIRAVLNVPIYAVTFILSVVPSVLPAGYTNPNSMTLSGTTEQIIIPATNFQYYVGISPGTYPSSPAAVETDLSSNKIPSNSPITTVLFLMQGCNNSSISNSPQTIYSANISGTQYGAQIVPNIYNPLWTQLDKGTYSQFVFSLSDQNNNPLIIIDPTELFICLSIRNQRLHLSR